MLAEAPVEVRQWRVRAQDVHRVTAGGAGRLPADRAAARPAGAEVAERGSTVTEAGRWQHVSWPVTHAAFAERADPVLAAPTAAVAHLGIDEHRRGRPPLAGR